LKTIDTLVEDIQALLVNGVPEISGDLKDRFSAAILAAATKGTVGREEREFTLRMSNIGKACARQLWLQKNQPQDLEKLTADTLLKFKFGDLTEELILLLAEIAGHRVEGRQDEVQISGIKGHWDAIIDGVLVDVKSASTYSFQKFKDGLTKETDAFGYLVQLGSYLHAGQDHPLVLDKTRAAFLAFDKSAGHMCLDFHARQDLDWEAAYERRIEIVNGPDLPDRAFEDEPDGYKKDGKLVANGNRKLGINCSYCDAKFACWPELRTFLSSRGPVFLTVVKKEPKMYELKRTEKEEIIVPEDPA
jgi:hypothetical protein